MKRSENIHSEVYSPTLGTGTNYLPCKRTLAAYQPEFSD